MADCEYCHGDLDDYTKPLAKNAHAYIDAVTHKLVFSFGRETRECEIKYCPMCGRGLSDG